MPKPSGKFSLGRYSGISNGHHEWLYVVELNGKFSHVWCDHKIRPKDEALFHFWRWIGAM